MRHPYFRFLSAGLLAFLILGFESASAQTLFVGAAANGGYDGNLNRSGPVTVIELGGANVDGQAASATFGWSTSPCPAAVKIKFFRPVSSFGSLVEFDFLAERGPFSVTQAVQTSNPLLPPVLQTVVLDPPVSLHAGDMIAIGAVTSCGAPTLVNGSTVPVGAPPPQLPPALVVAGDVTSTIPRGTTTTSETVLVYATGPSPELPLLSARFRVTLLATDPRSRAVAAGVPVQIGNAAGYFSLPDFTGDATFPEVMVKMVDATAAPGGGFWFFHSPLTDVQYTITVTDQGTGASKTYSNTASAVDQLCGAVDANAFPAP